MGMQESSTFYILQVDNVGKVIGTDEQQLTGDIHPSLTEGDIVVSKKLFDTVVMGQERYEAFRYVGGDLIWDGPDLETILRMSKQRLQKSADRAATYCTFCVRDGGNHTLSMDADLLPRMNTALATHQALHVLDTFGDLLKLELPTLRRVARDYIEKCNQITIMLHGVISKMSGLKSSSQINDLTTRMCNRIEGM
jgi:hypothetical protein